jgi:hypothetical protein
MITAIFHASLKYMIHLLVRKNVKRLPAVGRQRAKGIEY